MTPTRGNDGTAYTLEGPQGAPTVILIHGLGLTRRIWRWHLPEVTQHYRVLCYDLYGHGDSPLPAPPDLSLFSQQLRGLMDELDIEKAALVGFSLGGMINRRYALDYPQRVLTLILFNSPHERRPEEQQQVEKLVMASAAEGPRAHLEATMNRWFTQAFQTRHPAVMHEVRSWILANDPHTYALCRQVLAFGIKELVQPSPPIGVPTLVMTAEHDRGSTPAMAEAIAAEIPGSEVQIVRHLKHMALVESPESFIQPMLAFLERNL